MNECVKYRDVNWYDDQQKVPFDKIYSDEIDSVMPVVNAILTLWDLRNGKNKIRVV